MTDFVLLTKVYGPAEAEIVKAKLIDAGLAVHTKGEAIRDLYGIHIDGLGAVEVYVREEDLMKFRANRYDVLSDSSITTNMGVIATMVFEGW